MSISRQRRRHLPGRHLVAALLACLGLPTAGHGEEQASAAEHAEQKVSAAEQYWTPRDQLPPAVARWVPPYCDGAYRQPQFPYPRSIEDVDYPVHAEARRVEYWTEGRVALSESVAMRQGNRSLVTEHAAFDRGSGDGSLSGGVLMVEPQVALQGRGAQMNLDTREASMQDVDFLLFDAKMRGRAERVDRDGEGTLRMQGGSFTRCEPGNNGWRVSSSAAQIKRDARYATARNAVFRTKGVPIFYTPWIRFPVSDERQSGFLFPSFEFSGKGGTDIALPYYLNLAPNYDATLVPRYIEKRGMNVEGEFRHLNRWQHTTLAAAILPKDDLYDGVYRRDDFDELVSQGVLSGEFEPANRWLYAMDHRGRLGRFSTYVDYTAVSDRDYFRDLGSDLGVASRIDLERRGEISYNHGGLYARLWAQRFQRLDEVTVDPYQRLPELEVSYEGSLFGPLRYSLSAEWVTFTRNNDDLPGAAAVVGDRLHVEPRLQVLFNQPWGFLSLGGGYRYTRYDLDDVIEGRDERPDRGIALGSAGAGLFFERELEWLDTELVQTLEPRVYYLYQQFEDQRELPNFDTSELTFRYDQLYRDNRFSGLDRIGDAKQLSVGVTTRLLNAGNGREYLRLSVGEIVYFRDRQVSLRSVPTERDRHSTSPLAGELVWRILGPLALTGTVVWDRAEDEVDELAVAVQYRRDRRHIVNLGYRRRPVGDIDQSDFSIYWPLGKRLGVIGRWNYDFKSRRTIEGIAGIEYNNCCWQLRVVARRFLDNPSARNFEAVEADEGVFMQIVFRGLAGFGTTLESVLQRGIRGYSTEELDGL